MSVESLPENVRYSALSLALADKLSSSQPVAFDYWGEFRRLRMTVSAELGEMKVLFPEFTPHDEAQHLARLFGIADKLLEPQRYARMNAAELFLLACGLYAHDWGMAVGREELAFLRAGARTPIGSQVFTPLDDEAQRLRQFAETQGIRSVSAGAPVHLSDDQLRLYIRQTHAWRSGVRARTFFEACGSSIPQALEQVCQGHWLQFSELDDERRFSSQTGVLGHTVNLRAVALYVRLVDLFDISDDRTPYAVWRFVAPADDVSKMEWKKHRALSPVTFPKYGDGRAVRFDGATPDPEVWAELEDLRSYCEQQITGALDLMARHDDERHQLDLRKLEWAVTAERFKPVNIQFELHRQRSFEILADEVYQEDSHVFLRELLQNSIDAVRTRGDLVRQRSAATGRLGNLGLGFDDAVYFDVQHGTNGDAVVRCRDYGIGMDEYVVRNYLAVAGVSYYQSDDFKHLGLQIDPISRFGIGILSCFMIADRIEIDTYREPQVARTAEPLYIDIPAVDRQFRIYPGRGRTDIGTTVTVHVRGSKLKSDARTDIGAEGAATSKLQVTAYLTAVAGFIPCPIVVNEDGVRTVILHPDRPRSDADAFRLPELQHHVRQLSSTLPWQSLFAPQDAHLADRCLTQQVLSIRSDLGLQDYEGVISYVRPLDKNAVFRDGHIGVSSGFDELIITSPKCHSVIMRREIDYGLGYQRLKKTGISPSSRTATLVSVYRDGILVPDAEPPARDARFLRAGPSWPLPTLHVNLPGRIAGNLDVTRRALSGMDRSWDQPIWRAVSQHLKDNEIADALQQNPPRRLIELSKLAFIYYLPEAELADLVPPSCWPLLVVMPASGAKVLDNQLLPGEVVWTAPELLTRQALIALRWGYTLQPRDTDLLISWAGQPSVVLEGSALDDQLAGMWLSLSEWRLKLSLAPIGVRFLRPPYPGLPPLPQEEFRCVEPSPFNQLEIVERTMLDPSSLGQEGLCALRQISWDRTLHHIINAAPFMPPFEKFFMGDGSALNVTHPTTIALLRCVAASKWHRLKRSRDPADLGRADDHLKHVCNHLSYPQEALDHLWDFMKRSKFLDIDPPPPLRSEDYIPVSDSSGAMQRALDPHPGEQEELRMLTRKFLRAFGQPVRDITPEEAPEEIIKKVSELSR